MIDSIFPSISSILSITAIGSVFGLILSVARLKLRVEKDPRFEEILDALPNANCGACSYPGCSGYAMKVVEGSVEINLCPVGGAEVVDKIAKIMGLESETMISQKARVRCHGTTEATTERFIYYGPQNCEAALQLMDGFKVCEYSCLGLGDCEISCPFDAIHVDKTGIPVVNDEKCTGCGKCVEACPRSIIRLFSEDINLFVACMNQQKAKAVRAACTTGCISCNKCVKVCKEVFEDNPDIMTAITLENFLAVIDYDTCTRCGKCAEVCPRSVIDFKHAVAVIK